LANKLSNINVNLLKTPKKHYEPRNTFCKPHSAVMFETPGIDHAEVQQFYLYKQQVSDSDPKEDYYKSGM